MSTSIRSVLMVTAVLVAAPAALAAPVNRTVKFEVPIDFKGLPGSVASAKVGCYENYTDSLGLPNSCGPAAAPTCPMTTIPLRATGSGLSYTGVVPVELPSFSDTRNSYTCVVQFYGTNGRYILDDLSSLPQIPGTAARLEVTGQLPRDPLQTERTVRSIGDEGDVGREWQPTKKPRR